MQKCLKKFLPNFNVDPKVESVAPFNLPSAEPTSVKTLLPLIGPVGFPKPLACSSVWTNLDQFGLTWTKSQVKSLFTCLDQVASQRA